MKLFDLFLPRRANDTSGTERAAQAPDGDLVAARSDVLPSGSIASEVLGVRQVDELLADDRLWRGLADQGAGLDGADLLIFGAPIGVSSTAPRAIRSASLGLPPVSEELLRVRSKVFDLGDAGASFHEVERMAQIVAASGRPFIALGGDSSVLAAAACGTDLALGHSFGIIHVGARLDLSDRSDAQRSAMLRASELSGVSGVEDVMFVGVRDALPEEIKTAESGEGFIMTASRVRSLGVRDASRKIRKRARPYDAILLYVNMNALDLAFAPTADDPSTGGLAMDDLTTLTRELIVSLPIIGAALVESGRCREMPDVTASAAEHAVFSMIAAFDRQKSAQDIGDQELESEQ